MRDHMAESRSSAPRVIGHAGAAERRCPCPLLMRRHSHAHRTSCAASQSTIRHLLLEQSLVAPSDWNQTVPSCTMDHQSADSRLHFRQANARPSQSRGHGAPGSFLGLRCPWDIMRASFERLGLNFVSEIFSCGVSFRSFSFLVFFV